MYPPEEEKTYNENLLLAILRINMHIFLIVSVIHIYALDKYRY